MTTLYYFFMKADSREKYDHHIYGKRSILSWLKTNYIYIYIPKFTNFIMGYWWNSYFLLYITISYGQYESCVESSRKTIHHSWFTSWHSNQVPYPCSAVVEHHYWNFKIKNNNNNKKTLVMRKQLNIMQWRRFGYFKNWV